MKTGIRQEKKREASRINTFRANRDTLPVLKKKAPEFAMPQKQAEAIAGSPLLSAQLKKTENLFGRAGQRKTNPEEEEMMQQKAVAQCHPDRTTHNENPWSKTIQRLSGPDEEELIQGKFSHSGLVQRLPDEEEEIPAQGKFKTAQKKENSTGMPDSVKSGMEESFNTDFSEVKVHAESAKAPEAGALAYTQGQNIHFAPGQFKPESADGRQLLGHELAHVVQQREGRVAPTGEIAGLPVNDDPSLENEADAMGAKASR